MDVDPNTPRRPWLASISRISFFLICFTISFVLATLALIISIIIVMSVAPSDATVVLMPIGAALIVFIATAVLLVRRRKYLNSSAWLLRVGNATRQAAATLLAQSEAEAPKEWRAVQSGAQENRLAKANAVAQIGTKQDAKPGARAILSTKQAWRHRPAKEAQPKEIMENVEWHYELRGKRRGPVSADDIHALIQDGIINAETLVWRKGFREWIRVEETDLRDYISYDTPPPLPNDEGKRSVIRTIFSVVVAIGTAILFIVRFLIGLAARNRF
jgi:hypothetical protein